MIRFASLDGNTIAYSVLDYTDALAKCLGKRTFDDLNFLFYQSYNEDDFAIRGPLERILGDINNCFNKVPSPEASAREQDTLSINLAWQLINDAYIPLFHLLQLGFFGAEPTQLYPMCLAQINGMALPADYTIYETAGERGTFVFTTDVETAAKLGFEKDGLAFGIFKKFVSLHATERYWCRQKYLVIDNEQVSVYAETERAYLVECEAEPGQRNWLQAWVREGKRLPAPAYVRRFPKGAGIEEVVREDDILGIDVWEQISDFIKPYVC